MSARLLGSPTKELGKKMQGTWWLISREDWTKDGERRIDPTLGADPIGILTYVNANFTAQFMKRERGNNTDEQLSYSGQNNTVAVGGYDAYFGKYKEDEASGRVLHTPTGSITPSNIGMTVWRDLRVTDNQLIIQLDTTTRDGEPITRTLTWKRVG